MLTWRDWLDALRTTVCPLCRPIVYSRGDRIRLLGPELTSKNSAVGIICTRTNVHQIAREAIDNATYVCEEHYGLFKGPPVQLICPKDLNFMYVPSHLVRPSALFLVIRFSSHRLTLLANAYTEPCALRSPEEFAPSRRRDARRRLRELPACQSHRGRGFGGAPLPCDLLPSKRD
jgi:hypothetical protein